MTRHDMRRPSGGELRPAGCVLSGRRDCGWRSIGLALLLVVALTDSGFTQDHPPATADTVAASPVPGTNADPATSMPTGAVDDSMAVESARDSLPAVRPRFGSPLSRAARVLSADSLTLLPYQYAGELLGWHAGMQLYDGGSPGQPGWLGMYGSSPQAFSLARDGMATDDAVTLRPDLRSLATEDADELVVHPSSLAFYHGRPGAIIAAEQRTRDRSAPAPYTRLRHTEAPYDYLFTDVVFAIDPSPHDNVWFGVTRETFGTGAALNTGRFRNTRSESWDARGAWRRDVTRALRMSSGAVFRDHMLSLNGGAQPWRDDPSQSYIAIPSDRAFADSAFDPILITYVNPTMETRTRRIDAHLDADLRWDAGGSQRSTARVAVSSQFRSYSDKLHLGLPDSVTRERIANDDGWSRIQFDLRHAMTLGFGTLEAGAMLSRYDVSYAGYSGSVMEGWNHSARALLTTHAGPVSIQAGLRADGMYGRVVTGAGGVASLDITDAIHVWAGASRSARAPSLFELAYASTRSARETGALDALETVSIAEGGVRWLAECCGIDVRAMLADVRDGTRISAAVVPDSLPSRALRFSPVIERADSPRRLGGISLAGRARMWGFELETRSQAGVSDEDDGLLPSPEFSVRTSLAWRGTLIAGTLDIRAGASYDWCSGYDATTYMPESDVFGVRPRGARTLTGIRAFTDESRIDVFLFATIKKLATIHVMAVNVLDHQSVSTSFLPRPDFGIRFGVDWILFE